MVTTSSKASFFQRLEESRLLNAEQLADAAEVGCELSDPEEIARRLVQNGLLSSWQAQQLLRGNTQFYLGKYKLIRLLGSGGMGSVFLAEHTTMNRRVAIKSIAPRLSRNPQALKQFLAEARTVASLDHPNIVHAYSVDEVDDRFFMVMEYIEGRDLDRVVRQQGPLSFVLAADYTRQAAEGLAHAHQQGVIHCDIKPANLVLNEQGVLKILDMGMARLASTEDDDSEDGGEAQNTPLGTVDYLAPEQALGSPHLDHRADIYSLGCTLYFLLTGRPPFPDGTLAERILKHQTAEPTPLEELRPETPADLVKLCRRMMAKAPQQRLSSAAEVAQFLADWEPPPTRLLRARPIEEETESQSQEAEAEDQPADAEASTGTMARAAALLMRYRWRSMAGAGALLLAGVGLGWLLTGGEHEKTPNDPAAEADADSGQPSERDEFEQQIEALMSQWPTDGSPSDSSPADGNHHGTATDAEDNHGQGTQPREGEPPQESAPADDGAPEQRAEPVPAEDAPLPSQPPEEPPSDPEDTGPKEQSSEGSPGEMESPESSPPAPEASPPPQDPFAGFPKALALAPLPSGDAGNSSEVTLGRVELANETPLDITLLGGSEAIRGARRFVLQEDQQDESARRWTISLRSESTQDAFEPVAALALEDSALVLRWAAEVNPLDAAYLSNCLLRLTAGGKSHTVALRTVQPANAIPLSLVRGISTGTIPFRGLPEAEKLRLEIYPPEELGQVAIEPSAAHPVREATTLRVRYRDRHGNDSDGLVFRLTWTARTAGLTYKLQLLEPPPATFQGVDVNQARNLLQEGQKQLENEWKDAHGEKKAALARQLQLVERKLWYLDMLEKSAAGAALDYRIVLPMGEGELVFVDTRAARAEPSGEPSADGSPEDASR